jgi:hypothetical protein
MRKEEEEGGGEEEERRREGGEEERRRGGDAKVLCFAGGGGYPSGARDWVVDGRTTVAAACTMGLGYGSWFGFLKITDKNGHITKFLITLQTSTVKRLWV